MAREWLKIARTRSGRHESWLRAEEIVAGGRVMTALTEHAPMRVVLPDERLQPSGQHRAEFRFSIAVPDNQLQGRQGDGVSFVFLRGAHLAFARYLDPKARPEESGFRPYTITWGRGMPALSLLPGPRNNATRDAGAIGNPRVWEDFPLPNFKRLGDNLTGPWVYEREQAYPRAWMPKQKAPLNPGFTAYTAAKQLLAHDPLYLRTYLISGWTAEPSNPPTGEVVNQNTLDIKRRVPGVIELQYQRVDKDCFVAVSDQRLPGWRAFVSYQKGNHEAYVAPAYGAFMAVPVAPGKATVTFMYQPWAFRIGLWSGLAGLGFLGGVTVAGRRRRRV